MLDQSQATALGSDPEELRKLAEMVRVRGSIQERIRKSEVGERLSEISRALAKDGAEEQLLAQAADLLPIDYLLPILREELHAYTSSDLYNVLAVSIQNDVLSGLQIWSDRNISITIATISPIDKNIRDKKRQEKTNGAPIGVTFGASDVYLRFLKSSGTGMTRWRAEPIGFHTAISPELNCEKLDEVFMKTGESIFIRGAEESWSFSTVPDSVITLGITRRYYRSPVTVQYNASSKLLESASAADDKSSRIQLLTTLLRSMDPASCTAQLVALLKHKEHFVRWYVARELIAVNAEVALPHIKKLKSDPHPQVAAAASATLSLMEGV